MSNTEVSNTAWLPQGPALLFAPADRPERFAKAADRSDMVILDLEDGCRAENRAEARKNVIHADLDPERTIVRINPIDSPDFAADLAAVTDSPFRTVMVPKVESALVLGDAGSNRRALPEDFRAIALIETPRGVVNLAEIAADPQVVALFWGAEDLSLIHI